MTSVDEENVARIRDEFARRTGTGAAAIGVIVTPTLGHGPRFTIRVHGSFFNSGNTIDSALAASEACLGQIKGHSRAIIDIMPTGC